MSRNGISVLVASQNEEVLLGWCILSFFDLADEIIVVDNGSSDASRAIAESLAADHPEKVHFFDAPHLRDLHENRQYALERSRYRWVVRADADYVCYPEPCRALRNRLLARKSRLPILHLAVGQPNLAGDFFHTWKSGSATGDDPSYERYRRFPWSDAMVRVYQRTPGFRFDRLGRTEGARYPAMLKRLIRCETLDRPLWMHSDIKSRRNMLHRTERTNWRELGDYDTFPDLDGYLHSVIRKKYRTTDLSNAARQCFERYVAPKLESYCASAVGHAKPPLIRCAEQHLPVYRLSRDGHRDRLNSSAEIAEFWRNGTYRRAIESGIGLSRPATALP